MKKLISILIVGMLLIGCSNSNGVKVKERTITKQELKNQWPIKTADKAIIKCYLEPDGTKAPVVIVNGIPYGLTGYADMHYGQNNLKAFNKIWANDPRLKGLKVNLSKLTDEALKLCDDKAEKWVYQKED